MTYEMAEDLSIRTIEDEIFILKRSASTIHSFNRTGAMVWTLLQKKTPVSDIARMVIEKFDVSLAIAENDVSEFLFALIQNKLIETKD